MGMPLCLFLAVPTVVTPWTVLTPRESMTTFTTSVPNYLSRVLHPRRICGRRCHPWGRSVQLGEHLHVFSAGLAHG